MKTKRIAASGFVALLMLTVLAIVPGGASPAPWDWASGTVPFHCIEGSHRNVSICVWPTDAAVLTKTIPYGCEQYYDAVYGSPVGGVIPITIPKDSYYSEPFFLKQLGTQEMYLWAQVYLVADGSGQLATAAGLIDVSPITINITGQGDGTFIPSIQVGDNVKDGAGSCLIYMPLFLDAWLGQPLNPYPKEVDLVTMNFSIFVTTGFIETRIDDTAGPFPPGPIPPPISMDGYYMNATGVPFDANTGAGTLAGAGAGLDILGSVPPMTLYTDFIFTDTEVVAIQPVGGVWTPVDKLALLAPYIGLASTIILAIAATAIFFKYRKKL